MPKTPCLRDIPSKKQAELRHGRSRLRASDVSAMQGQLTFLDRIANLERKAQRPTGPRVLNLKSTRTLSRFAPRQQLHRYRVAGDRTSLPFAKKFEIERRGQPSGQFIRLG